MLYQDMEMHDVPFGVISVKFQIQQLVGSYSGVKMKNYFKLDIKTPKFIIESDATIVAPLIFAYLLDL
jgi:deoxyhypusine synthase